MDKTKQWLPEKDEMVFACYDGKFGRRENGIVVQRRGFAIQVKFNLWGENEEITAWFVRTSPKSFGAYVKHENALMPMLFKCSGDWYSIYKNASGNMTLFDEFKKFQEAIPELQTQKIETIQKIDFGNRKTMEIHEDKIIIMVPGETYHICLKDPETYQIKTQKHYKFDTYCDKSLEETLSFIKSVLEPELFMPKFPIKEDTLSI